MLNSDAFLQHFTEIEAFLKKEQNSRSSASFSQRVKNSDNKAVKRYAQELFSYAELRNAIVHSPRINGNAIAEPHSETVENLKYIKDQILNPKKVLPTFGFKVLGAMKTDNLKDILEEMRTRSFSQFPVFNEDETIYELITSNTISRWIGSNIDNDGTILLEHVKIKNLIDEIENKHNYAFIGREASVYDAFSLFEGHYKKNGHYLDAVFITHSGNQNQKLLGLITISDFIGEVRLD